MTNDEKCELARLVKYHINAGRSMEDTVKRLAGTGFKLPTIKSYYKTFKEMP